ncbi:MAG: site-specific DNA-methyltransferase [Caldilineales bacterium]|nr:site-specific DNA-methyltransferase [Caldilineales bacterium]
MKIAYKTSRGTFLQGDAEDLLLSSLTIPYKEKVNLIFTSPPFPLIRKKKYGNLEGQHYIDWIAGFACIFRDLLKPDGSIVMEVGNSWEKGRPVMSTWALRALLAFLEEGNFSLCQQFIWHNPARLPSPAQWVNVERIRVKDSFTHLWWMSPTDRPKADNRRVLNEYSSSMKKLLKSKKYNAGKRPSEHDIGQTSFLRNNNGAIPSNVIVDSPDDETSNVITMSNTRARTSYLEYCRDNNLKPHPARMPLNLPKFFIEFLTEPEDLVLDPFAGSNTTGAAAEELERKWVAVELEEKYIVGSKGHFQLFG